MWLALAVAVDQTEATTAVTAEMAEALAVRTIWRLQRLLHTPTRLERAEAATVMAGQAILRQPARSRARAAEVLIMDTVAAAVLVRAM